ncbi:odorant receptor 13a-like [Vespa mandarinia]|uniref:odorant receptor 13a-like n=1 Tax=Vespa mandarinia TaxID=7446 RepID=UPI0016182C45|nr:odorant receptor 13a-like [Vespa mandarinia]
MVIVLQRRDNESKNRQLSYTRLQSVTRKHLIKLITLTQELEFDDTVNVIDMTKRTMNCAGIWPENTNEPKFIFFAIYLTIHCSLAVIDISMNITNLTYIVGCLLENVFNLMALLKICICRIKRKSLARLLEDVRTDFIIDNYNTIDEKIAFLSYNKFSRKFVKLTLIVCLAGACSYYFMSLVNNVEMVIRNSSYGYRLPYRVWLLIEPKDLITYICLCCYQFIIIPSIVFGYVGTDCLFVSLVLHVSGLFSALSCKVKHVLDDPNDRQRRMKDLIVKHVRLIRLSESLEDEFNLVILQQLVGNTFQLCLLGYDALASTAEGEGRMLVAFFLIVACVFSTLLAYCYMGECLIKESSVLGDAFYHCEWYKISRTEKKLMHICMMRSTKFMRLTSGKFCTLSLNTFTDVLKTSMAYFSVLRTFV